MSRVRPKAAPRARRQAHAAPRAPRPLACALITVSDTRRGAADTAGAAIASLLEAAGHQVAVRAWVRDDVRAIRRATREALSRPVVDALILTGGTGPAPRDVTPEAVEPFVQRWLPGFGEMFRQRSVAAVGTAAWLSRAAAGVAGGRLLVMLPGSEGAVRQAMTEVLLPELVHVVRLLGRFHTEE